LLRLVFSLAVAAWFGSVFFFSFVVAPAAHRNFPGEARRFLRPIFTRYYRLGVLCGFVALGAVLLGREGLSEGELARLALPVALALVASLYGGEVLRPRLRDKNADDPDYARLHQFSAMLNSATLAALGLALAGAIFR
jgi:hypothetical protein